MLSSKIKNYEFKNPILVASGTYGYGDEVKDIVDVDSLGGIVTKSVTLFPREGNPPPRIAETASGQPWHPRRGFTEVILCRKNPELLYRLTIMSSVGTLFWISQDQAKP